MWYKCLCCSGVRPVGKTLDSIKAIINCAPSHSWSINTARACRRAKLVSVFILALSGLMSLTICSSFFNWSRSVVSASSQARACFRAKLPGA